MVEIVTLLLGLTVGPETIEVAVAEPVARVELRLDGRTAATLAGAPWSAQVDFGERLAPRLLEAFAFDGEGKRLGSAQQLVNYARSNYEAAIALEGRLGGGRRPGRVVWEAILEREPKRIELTLDGRTIPVDGDGRFVLPALPLTEAHFLRAVLHFADGESAEADLVFGGTYGDRVESTLTAVPVLVPEDSPMPSIDRMQDWFSAGETNLGVFSTSRGAAKVMVVYDGRVGHHLRDTYRELRRLGSFPLPAIIGVDDTVQFVPTASLAGHPGHFRAVEVGPAKKRAGLWELIAYRSPRSQAGNKREIWASVAAAARGATEGNRRRAVVVLLGTPGRDRSAISPSQAIGYLRSVRVPHFVWASRARDLPEVDPALAARIYVGAEGLARLFADLDRSLRAQRIVWLEGTFFPAQIETTVHLPSGFGLAE